MSLPKRFYRDVGFDYAEIDWNWNNFEYSACLELYGKSRIEWFVGDDDAVENNQSYWQLVRQDFYPNRTLAYLAWRRIRKGNPNDLPPEVLAEALKKLL